jgi:hypothetical protein
VLCQHVNVFKDILWAEFIVGEENVRIVLKWHNAKKTVTLLDETNDYISPCIYIMRLSLGLTRGVFNHFQAKKLCLFHY